MGVDRTTMCSKNTDEASREKCMELLNSCEDNARFIECIKAKAVQGNVSIDWDNQQQKMEDLAVEGELKKPEGMIILSHGPDQSECLKKSQQNQFKDADEYIECLNYACEKIEERPFPLTVVDRSGVLELGQTTSETVVRLGNSDELSLFTAKGTPVTIDQYCGEEGTWGKEPRKYKEIGTKGHPFLTMELPLCWNDKTTFIWRSHPTGKEPGCVAGGGRLEITHQPTEEQLRTANTVNLQATITWEAKEDLHNDVDVHLIRLPLTSDRRELQCFYGNCKRGVDGSSRVDWGEAGNSNDDPYIDIDCREKSQGCSRQITEAITNWGPENIRLSSLEPGNIYMVAVRAFNITKRITTNVAGYGEASCTSDSDFYAKSDSETRQVKSTPCTSWVKVEEVEKPANVTLTVNVSEKESSSRFLLSSTDEAFIAGIVLPKKGGVGEQAKWEFIPTPERDREFLRFGHWAKTKKEVLQMVLPLFLHARNVTEDQRMLLTSFLINQILEQIDVGSRVSEELMFRLKGALASDTLAPTSVPPVVEALEAIIGHKKRIDPKKYKDYLDDGTYTGEKNNVQKLAAEIALRLAKLPGLDPDSAKRLLVIFKDLADEREGLLNAFALHALGELARSESPAAGESIAFLKTASSFHANPGLRAWALEQLIRTAVPVGQILDTSASEKDPDALFAMRNSIFNLISRKSPDARTRMEILTRFTKDLRSGIASRKLMALDALSRIASLPTTTAQEREEILSQVEAGTSSLPRYQFYEARAAILAAKHAGSDRTSLVEGMRSRCLSPKQEEWEDAITLAGALLASDRTDKQLRGDLIDALSDLARSEKNPEKKELSLYALGRGLGRESGGRTFFFLFDQASRIGNRAALAALRIAAERGALSPEQKAKLVKSASDAIGDESIPAEKRIASIEAIASMIASGTLPREEEIRSSLNLMTGVVSSEERSPCRAAAIEGIVVALSGERVPPRIKAEFMKAVFETLQGEDQVLKPDALVAFLVAQGGETKEIEQHIVTRLASDLLSEEGGRDKKHLVDVALVCLEHAILSQEQKNTLKDALEQVEAADPSEPVRAEARAALREIESLEEKKGKGPAFLEPLPLAVGSAMFPLQESISFSGDERRPRFVEGYHTGAAQTPFTTFIDRCERDIATPWRVHSDNVKHCKVLKRLGALTDDDIRPALYFTATNTKDTDTFRQYELDALAHYGEVYRIAGEWTFTKDSYDAFWKKNRVSSFLPWSDTAGVLGMVVDTQGNAAEEFPLWNLTPDQFARPYPAMAEDMMSPDIARQNKALMALTNIGRGAEAYLKLWLLENPRLASKMIDALGAADAPASTNVLMDMIANDRRYGLGDADIEKMSWIIGRRERPDDEANALLRQHFSRLKNNRVLAVSIAGAIVLASDNAQEALNFIKDVAEDAKSKAAAKKAVEILKTLAELKPSLREEIEAFLQRA